jgi:hypothetical protein
MEVILLRTEQVCMAETSLNIIWPVSVQYPRRITDCPHWGYEFFHTVSADGCMDIALKLVKTQSFKFFSVHSHDNLIPSYLFNWNSVII